MFTLRTLLKIIFTLYNAMLVLLGVGCVTLAIIFLIRMGEVKGLSDFLREFKAQSIASGIFILGVLMITTCIIGCLASSFDSHILAISHAILMLLLLIVTVILSVSIYADISSNDSLISEKMDEYWSYRSKNGSFSKLSALQYALKCCGRNEPDDYGSEELPSTCCPLNRSNCTAEKAYKKGCEAKLKEFLRKYSKPFGYICLAITLFVFAGFLLATCLVLFLYHKV